MHRDWSALREAFERDGVVRLEAALDAAAVADARAAYEWSFANPGPAASKIRQAGPGVFYNDLYNPDVMIGYRAMLQRSPLTGMVAELWGGSPVWFMYEQVFLKEGGESRRTPWHQDSSYLAIGGRQLAVAWISFDSVGPEDALEFVRGSHRGVLYNGSRFELGDDTAPLHATEELPRLPDIEGSRTEYDIVSWPVEPGDVIVFHPAVLHGGAATREGKRRRTLTLRYFGEDATYAARPGRAGPPFKDFHQRMQDGAPFRDPAFLQLA